MVETFENKYDEPQDENTRWSNFFRDLKKSIRVMLPCEIVSIASDFKTVNVKILDKDVDNLGNIIDYPIITNCPIRRTSESGSAYIHLPPVVGDQGTIEFFDSSVDEMFVLDNPIYDENEEWHHLSNGLFTNGFSSKSKSFIIDETAPIVIGLKSGNVILKFKEDGLYLEGNLNIDGNLEVSGTIKAGNGSTGTYTNSVTTADGIVTGGS